jgi:hypothetical protein
MDGDIYTQANTQTETVRASFQQPSLAAGQKSDLRVTHTKTQERLPNPGKEGG